MIVEHLVYNSALAILVGMIFHRLFPDEPQPYAWIIVLSAFSPDLVSWPIGIISRVGIPITLLTAALRRIGLYSEAILIGYMVIVGLFFLLVRFRFVPSALCAGIGYYAHLAEDNFAYFEIYRPFWSSFSQVLGLGLYRDYHSTIFGIANVPVLILGIGLFVTAIGIRVAIDGTDWIRHPFGSTSTVAAVTDEK